MTIKKEIVIIGGGPAGLAAAIEAAKRDAGVLLIDENKRPGGQLFKQIHKFFGSKAHNAGVRGVDIGKQLLVQTEETGVEIWLDSAAVGIFSEKKVAVLHEGTTVVVQAERILISTGATENALRFKGWTLPGVMGAGAAQTMVNVNRVLPGKRILMVGSGNVGVIVAYQLMQAGANVVGIVEGMDHIGAYEMCIRDRGYTFCTVDSNWIATRPNQSLRVQGGEDADFRSYKVVGNGVTAEETTYNSRNTLGWGDWCITKNCKDPVAAMQFCNFMASEEGQYLTLWGVEGEHWDYVDGKHQPKPEVLDSYRADEVACSRETGIRRYRMFVKNGEGKDGTPYDLVTKWEPTTDWQYAYQASADTDLYDNSYYAGLEPAGSTPEGLIAQKVADIYDEYVPKMVNAASQEDCVAQYEAMISNMETAGLVKLEEVMTKNYLAKMERWGVEPYSHR